MAAFDAGMFCFILTENLEELLMKDVFETMFCLHEVGQSLTDLFKLLELILCTIKFLLSSMSLILNDADTESKLILTLTKRTQLCRAHSTTS